MYTPKTKPYRHQLQAWEAVRDRPAWGHLWDRGVGKTKITLDTAGWLFDRGLIDGLLVVAPNSIKRVWADEAEKHLAAPYLAHVYDAKKASTQAHQRQLEELYTTDGLAILSINYEALPTAAGAKRSRGRETVERFLKTRNCLMVVDEAHAIKSANAKRTKAIIALGKKAPYRRVLTGTLVANSPLDVYTVMRFLEPDFWHDYGIRNSYSFRAQFANLVEQFWGGRRVTQVDGYQNLDRLTEIIGQLTDLIDKEDTDLDLPPKTYSVSYFDLEPGQARIYRRLRDEFIAELAEGTVEAPLALTRLLRLQQVACGYAPIESGKLIPVSTKNPRLQVLEEALAGHAGQAIIWCRFREDVDQVFRKLGGDTVRIDGTVDTLDRAKAVEAFQEGRAKYLVANPACAGEGITLTAATLCVYYSNSFSLVQRLQSEDRAHRIGQTKPVHYIDIVANHTVDEAVVRALIEKQDLAKEVLSGELRRFI